MKEVFHEAVTELDRGHPVVVATVVHTKGSTPQKPGAKLLVRDDGTGVGTLGGGCVEGDIWFAAKELLANGGGPQMRDYILNEDLAAQDGLVCGGTMYFLIDPVRSTQEYLNLADEVVRAYEGGMPVAVANLMIPPPGLKLNVGNKLLIRENGTTEGTLGDIQLDEDAVCRARTLMAMGRNEYVISENGAEYFLEAYTTPPTLVIAGGGHVAKALAPIAASVGMRIFIIDDRSDFANSERFPEAERVVVEEFSEGMRTLPINENTFIVIATRGHRYDDSALETAAKTRARYVALLGSKRKTILIAQALLDRGMSADRLRQIRAPAGLDIGGRTPEEIAISIMAEILMFRFGGTGGEMKLEQHQIDRIVGKIETRQRASVTDA